MTEFRHVSSEHVRVVDDAKHQLEIESCVYNVVDDYKTRWIPGVFTRSLEEKKPPLCWAHNWAEPIGHLVDYTDGAKSLRTLYQLSDFDAVPRARQGWSQYKDGTLTDASFGFSRHKEEPADGLDGVFDIREARLDETSLVLAGAVPGVKIVGSRGIASVEFLGLARSLEAGDLTLEQALAVVARASGHDVRARHSHAKQDGSGSESHSHANDGAMHAHSGLMPVARAITAGSLGATSAAGVDDLDPDDTVKCPKCGAMNEADATYCDQCGAKLPLRKRDANEDLAAEARSILTEIAASR